MGAVCVHPQLLLTSSQQGLPLCNLGLPAPPPNPPTPLTPPTPPHHTALQPSQQVPALFLDHLASEHQCPCPSQKVGKAGTCHLQVMLTPGPRAVGMGMVGAERELRDGRASCSVSSAQGWGKQLGLKNQTWIQMLLVYL